MSESRSTVRAPLFDRLVDSGVNTRSGPRSGRTLDRTGLLDSVRREVEQLLNTRCSIPAERVSSSERSVIDYGMPDPAPLSASNPDDLILLGNIVSSTVQAFEPRLKRVRATVARVEGSPRSASARIEALLLVDSVAEPVSFEVPLLDPEAP